MRLASIEVSSFRSIFGGDDGDSTLEIDLTTGLNAIVGPNNSGKSNVLAAVALALEDGHPFDIELDRPAAMAWANPRVLLTFECDGQETEATLLRYAHEYEKAMGAGRKTYAADGRLLFNVRYRAGNRLEGFRARGQGGRLGAADSPAAQRLLRKFRENVRLVYVRSGENVESLLQGRFRDILHTVVAEHLGSAVSAAERRREEYVAGLSDALLASLQDRIGVDLARMFTEITSVGLEPRVPSISDTLGNVIVNLEDAARTSLTRKGTGLRGAVLASMLHYMADETKRSMVMAIEEPESFLHPAAQEDLRETFETLAERPRVTVLATTHSPHIVSRAEDAQVIELVKTGEGATRVAGRSRGPERVAQHLLGLYRDPSVPLLIERGEQVPGDARGIVVVEGDSDIAYLRFACRVAGREDLLDGLHLVAASGATQVPIAAAYFSALTTAPIVVVLDSDAEGRKVRAKLATLRIRQPFGWLQLAEVLPKKQQCNVAEAEDLWPEDIVRGFIAEHGEAVVAEEERQGSARPHIGLTSAAKQDFCDWVEACAEPHDADLWISVAQLINDKIDDARFADP